MLQISGAIIAPVALLFMGYSLFMYKKRTIQVLFAGRPQPPLSHAARARCAAKQNVGVLACTAQKCTAACQAASIP